MAREFQPGSSHSKERPAGWIWKISIRTDSIPSPLRWTWAKTGSIAFVGSYAHSPLELYYMSSPGAPPRQLTRFNEPVAALSLGKVQAIQWQGPDGWRENGI